jgi:rod shape-determining protein MreC
LVLLLASITVITLSFRGGTTGWVGGVRGVATDVFSPIQSAAGDVFGPIGNFFEGAANFGSLKSENAKLRAEVARLKATSSAAGVTESKLAALAAQEHLSFAPNLAHVVTQVVTGSASNFQDTIQLSKGSGAGIRVGMPAVSGTGLVGTVVQVAADRSTVLLLTDPTSNVGVQYTAKGTSTGLALATGQGVGKALSVSLIAPGTVLFKDEEMVTGGALGSPYPPGIPVGTVASASQSPGSHSETVTLNPIVDTSKLEFVSVLLFQPPSVIP